MRGGGLRPVLASGVLVFSIALTLTAVPGASAATEPGTPLAVAPGVPDQGRGWELVTPSDPVSAIMHNVRALSADGNRVSYMTLGALPGAPAGAPFPSANVATRGTNGWDDQPTGAPYPLLGAPETYFSSLFYPGPLQITLPRALRLDSSDLQELCSRFDAGHGSCPQGSKVGSAFARTPLLKGAMRGSVYLAQPKGNGSPDLWAQLGGGGIEVSLRGETAVKDGRAQTAFAHTPDFPLASFKLRFAGGRHGVMELKGDPCGGMRAGARVGGQNGPLVGVGVEVGVGCIAQDRHG
jgi:hypothetical protein